VKPRDNLQVGTVLVQCACAASRSASVAVLFHRDWRHRDCRTDMFCSSLLILFVCGYVTLWTAHTATVLFHVGLGLKLPVSSQLAWRSSLTVIYVGGLCKAHDLLRLATLSSTHNAVFCLSFYLLTAMAFIKLKH